MENKRRRFRFVQDLERFFNSEFETEELVQAVEEMNVFAEEQAENFCKAGLEPKTVALGVLAGCKIRKIYGEEEEEPETKDSFNYYSQVNLRNESYKIGMEIVGGKYETLEEAIYAYEKAF